MKTAVDYESLVRRARLGDEASLERLSEAAGARLRTDLFRLTLDADLTEDIVQETILEMIKLLGELKDADRFWPWLYKIALNKLRFHHRRQTHRKASHISPRLTWTWLIRSSRNDLSFESPTRSAIYAAAVSNRPAAIRASISFLRPTPPDPACSICPRTPPDRTPPHSGLGLPPPISPNQTTTSTQPARKEIRFFNLICDVGSINC